MLFWSPDVKSWFIGKGPDAGKDWGQKQKRVSEDEMAGWHHRCNGHELGQTLGDGERRGTWHAAVHGVTKCRTRLEDWTTWLNYFAIHLRVLVAQWLRIHLPGRRCRFDPCVGTIPSRRKWQSTPVFLPGKPHGQWSLAGYSPWGQKRVGYELATKQHQHLRVTQYCKSIILQFKKRNLTTTPGKEELFAHRGWAAGERANVL